MPSSALSACVLPHIALDERIVMPIGFPAASNQEKITSHLRRCASLNHRVHLTSFFRAADTAGREYLSAAGIAGLTLYVQLLIRHLAATNGATP